MAFDNPGEGFDEREGWGAKPTGGRPTKNGGKGQHEVLSLSFGFEATRPRPMGTIVEGLLHAGSVTLIYGPPKSGKSFIATDLALSVAAGDADWMGHKIVKPGPVLYVACEGHAGFWKRLEAAKRFRGWNASTFPRGFILATGRPMLIRADERGMTYAPDPSSIIQALAKAKQEGLTPGTMFIDTVFRSFGAGNVNASQDMNIYLASIAALTDESYAVALVHHEIKAGGTPAGSVSLIGGADSIVHVWRKDVDGVVRYWQLEMAKDDAETEPRAFTLEVVPIGQDPDGQPASSCVIRDEGAAPDAKVKARGRPPSSGSAKADLADLIYTELCNLLACSNEVRMTSFEVGSPQIRVVSRPKLRQTVNQAGILVPLPDGPDRKRVKEANDKQYQRAINYLKKHKKIGINDECVGVI